MINNEDLRLLREVLCKYISKPDTIEIVLTDAGLQVWRIRLNGDVESQWHNILNHADSQGAAALAGLLTAAGKTAPKVWEEAEVVLQRYQARRGNAPASVANTVSGKTAPATEHKPQPGAETQRPSTDTAAATASSANAASATEHLAATRVDTQPLAIGADGSAPPTAGPYNNRTL